MLNCWLSTIQNIIKKDEQGLPITDKPRGGRPMKTTERERCRLIVESKSNPKLTSKQLNSDWITKQPVSQSTVKRILRDNGLFGRVAAKKPALSIQQIKKRTTYCKQHQDWNINEWSAVIFSDESKIELNPESREYVRRPNNQ